MTRAQAMDVMNEATETQIDIDAMLRRQDDQLNWDPAIEWYPGDPLYTNPRDVYQFPYMRVAADGTMTRATYDEFLQDETDAVYEEWNPQCIRPMFQVFEAELDDTMGGGLGRCEDCQVRWAGDDPCFVCGKDCPLPPWQQPLTRPRRIFSQQRIQRENVIDIETEGLDVASWLRDEMSRMLRVEIRASMEGFRESAERTSESLNRFQYGVDRGMLYMPDGEGIAWNGLTTVTETPGDVEHFSVGPFSMHPPETLPAYAEFDVELVRQMTMYRSAPIPSPGETLRAVYGLDPAQNGPPYRHLLVYPRRSGRTQLDNYRAFMDEAYHHILWGDGSPLPEPMEVQIQTSDGTSIVWPNDQIPMTPTIPVEVPESGIDAIVERHRAENPAYYRANAFPNLNQERRRRNI